MRNNLFYHIKKLLIGASIRKKILIGMLTISCSVALLISIIVGMNINSFVAANNIKDSNRNISNVLKKIDLVLHMAEINGKSIVSNQRIQSILIKSNKLSNSTYSDTVEVKEELLNVIASNDAVDAAILYDLKGNVFTSDVNIKDSFATVLPPSTKEWIGTRTDIYTPVRKAYTNKDHPVITLRSPMYNYNNGKLLGCVEIYITEAYIRNLYSMENIGKNSEISLVNNEWIIQSSSNLTHFNSQDNNMKDITSSNGYFINRETNTQVVYKYYKKMDWYIIENTDMITLSHTRNAILGMITLVGLTGIFFSVILCTVISKTITKPLQYLSESVKALEKGNFSRKLEVIGNDEISILANEFNAMLYNQEQLVHKLVYEQMKKKEYALELVQDQVKPHFLYNTLDNLCALAELKRNEELIDMVMNLSNFYRGVLSRGEMLIPIKKEIDILNSYLKILSIRYKNKFEYTINVDITLENFLCPKLMLQPIVENAIYHGIKSIKSKGILSITICEQNDDIVMSIKDNGKGITKERIYQIFNDKGCSFGVKNTDERIKMHYGSQYGLTIEAGQREGTIVTVKISKKLTN